MGVFGDGEESPLAIEAKGTLEAGRARGEATIAGGDFDTVGCPPIISA